MGIGRPGVLGLGLDLEWATVFLSAHKFIMGVRVDLSYPRLTHVTEC